ncbi:conserved exported protein of unknown function [Candidatus Hydrogenisulfobacillus filiaventi]|uniref:Uncharacterized protein n=1 Tax=Candidatus Hydrogenisulfobacillus filiaventi TaxID=2707344 RepID=A0A6F8ZIK8_9FIRM|nr:hypothetical protein [Bacillota bacterium]CAB1129628.1 conserved exported protein of unknown function [Candidatus Hydrogenisulfobacillus filiaventi]
MTWRRLAALGAAVVGLLACSGSAPVPAPPGAAALYSRGGSLWLQPLSAAGRPRGAPVRLGRLGLAGPWNLAVAWRGGVAVATGRRLLWWRPGRLRTLATAPSGCALMGVARGRRRLWRLEACPARRTETVEAGGMAPRRLPSGIPYLFAGPGGHPAALLTRPRSGVLLLLGGAGAGWRRRLPVPPVGTAIWNGRAFLVPLWAGAGHIRLARVPLRGPLHLGPAAPPVLTPLAVGGRPGWVLTAAGLERPGATAPALSWPAPPAQTPWPAGQAGGWLLIQDGFSQGFWFAPAAGTFGGELRWSLPPGAVGRALVPYGAGGR